MIAKQAAAAIEAPNLIDVFRKRVAMAPDRTAARTKAGGAWRDVPWKELLDKGKEAAYAVMALGVQPKDRVCIIAGTRLEWIVADLGIQTAGAVCVPIYQSNTPEECEFVVNNAGAVAIVCENAAQLEKFKKVKDKLKNVRNIVMMDGPGDGAWVLSWDEFIAKGKEYAQGHAGEDDKRLAGIQADEISTIIYTSGTTGVPKGVMLTHKNFATAAQGIAEIQLTTGEDTLLLFLPLAHSFAQILKAAWYATGLVMAFAESLEKLVDNLGEVKPTVLPAVPRVFEKIYNGVVAKGTGEKGVKGILFRRAMREFEEYAKAREAGKAAQLGFVGRLILQKKVPQALQQRTGGRIKFFISGGAPLARKIAYFFDLTGFKICEGYGLTETTAVTSVNRPDRIRIGTVGQTYAGTEVKLAEDGEILIRGGAVMKGYWNLPEATAEVIDKDGWFHSGDIGEVDGEGYIRITDRKKDLIKTSGGKYIAPAALEGGLKGYPIVSQVVIIGDMRKFVSALVTVSEDAAKKWATERGVAYKDYAELTQKSEIRAMVQTAVDAVNAAQPSYSTMKKFTVLDRDFSQETGELTPSLKVKRKFCTQKYAAQIDAMYAGAD